MGRLRFNSTGEYELGSGGAARKGRYVFFRINGDELLELRPDGPSGASESRSIYRVESAANSSAGINLSRVRLGVTGIQDLHEGTITLTPPRE
jgi:hypothetical protein